MSVKLNNNTFINCKKAISAPETVDFEMNGNRAINTEQVLELRKTDVKEKWYQKWWGILILGVIASLVAGVLYLN